VSEIETEEIIEESTGEVLTINVSTDKMALYNPIEAGIAGLVEKYKEGPKDLAIPANYKECQAALSATRGIRGKTEKLRKELKADALAYGRLVDATAKRIVDQVQLIEEPYATAKKDYDTAVEVAKREKALAEERRVDGISQRIAQIGALVTAHVSSSAAAIEELLPGLALDLSSCGDWAMEFSDKAETVINDTMVNLEELRAMKVAAEQAAADRARAEKEAADREEAARVQREKEAAEERARLAKEREAIEIERAAMQAERDRLAAEQAERDRAAAEIQAEKDRVAKAEQDRLSAEQAEKERLFDQERAKMAAEIEALKLKEVKVQPVVEPIQVVVEEQPVTAQAAPDSCPGEDYKAAGRAIMAITGPGSKAIAKELLDTIINGGIPNIIYTGAAQ